ncbi:ribose-phosphate pyrophosphokinase, partial [Phenoliferia sp. Uapishka_3]
MLQYLKMSESSRPPHHFDFSRADHPSWQPWVERSRTPSLSPPTLEEPSGPSLLNPAPPFTHLPPFSASSMATALDLSFALFHKERKKANEIARMVLVGDVKGKVAILIDDMADTCGTLSLAAKHLLAGGAKSVLALVTHGILSGPALRVLNESKIERLIVTNSIPQRGHKEGCAKVKEIDVSHVLAEAVRRSYYGESVSGEHHFFWINLLLNAVAELPFTFQPCSHRSLSKFYRTLGINPKRLLTISSVSFSTEASAPFSPPLSPSS